MRLGVVTAFAYSPIVCAILLLYIYIYICIESNPMKLEALDISFLQLYKLHARCERRVFTMVGKSSF